MCDNVCSKWRDNSKQQVDGAMVICRTFLESETDRDVEVYARVIIGGINRACHTARKEAWPGHPRVISRKVRFPLLEGAHFRPAPTSSSQPPNTSDTQHSSRDVPGLTYIFSIWHTDTDSTHKAHRCMDTETLWQVGTTRLHWSTANVSVISQRSYMLQAYSKGITCVTQVL